MKSYHYLFWKLFTSSIFRIGLESLYGERWRGPLLRWGLLNVYFLCKPGDRMILCGNWDPQEVVRYRRGIGPRGDLLILEANAETSAHAESQFRKHPHPHPAARTVFMPKGVWSGPAELQMTQSVGAYHGLDRLNARGIKNFPEGLEPKVRAVDVPVDSLDNITEELGWGRVDLVVLTVNGAEAAAMEGMARLIRANPGLRIIINSNYPEPALEVSEIMTRYGLKVFTYKPQKQT